MPNSRPTATDLLEVIRQYLERDLSPLSPPLHQFQLRIVGRLLDTVRRELECKPAADTAELQRLSALLGRAGSPGELNRVLASRIRDGELATDDSALLAHLRQTIEDSLRINNPRWITTSQGRPA